MAMMMKKFLAIIVLVVLVSGCGSVSNDLPRDAAQTLEKAEKEFKEHPEKAEILLQNLLARHDRDWYVRLSVAQIWIRSGNQERGAEAMAHMVADWRTLDRPRPLTSKQAATLANAAAEAFYTLIPPDKVRSLEMSEVALELDPMDAGAANAVAWHFAEEGTELERALKLAQRAVGLTPDDGNIVDTLGWVYYKMGRTSDAVEWLKKAVALNPDSEELRKHLAEAHRKSGNIPGAYIEARKALLLTPALKPDKVLDDEYKPLLEIVRRYNPPGPL